MQREIELTTIESLRALHQIPIFNFGPPYRVKFAGSIEAIQDSEIWERKLDSTLSSCACQESAVGLLVASLTAPFVILAVKYSTTWELGWGKIALTAFGISIFGAVAGKGYGLLRARQSLRHALAEIEIRLA